MLELEAPKPKESNKNGQIIAGVMALIAISLVVVVLYIASSKPSAAPTLPNVARAGAAAFDAYKSKVELEIIDKIVHPNMVGMKQYEIKARVTNRGDRALTGIEIAGRMIDLSDQLIKEAISIPIPRARQEPLKPGESMAISVKVDGPAKISEAEVKDLLIELRGLQF